MTTPNSTYDLTPAEEMEAQEREQVIDDSVDTLIRYREDTPSDQTIERERLHLDDIVPDPADLPENNP